MNEVTPTSLSDSLEAVTEALHNDDQHEVSRLIEALQPAEIAHIFDALPADQRPGVFKFVPQSLEGEVLLHMGDVAATDLAEELDLTVIRVATDDMDTADVAELLELLPDETVEGLLESMDQLRRQRIEANLAFEEGTVGRIMHTDAVSIRSDVSNETVQRYLRKIEDLPEDNPNLMVVDRQGNFKGILPILTLVQTSPDVTVAEIMRTDVRTLDPEMSEREAAQIFEDHDLISAPVVDNDNRLLGRMVVDDVVDIYREQADQAALGPAGLGGEEDLFAPVLPSAQRRAVWLAANLATSLLAAWVIGLFAGTIDRIVALAVLMPIVASMGGIAGTQTLTLTIRGLALDQVNRNNTRWLLQKEVGVGLLNGAAWSLLVALIASLWFSQVSIGIVIAVAMMINLIVASAAGVLVPIVLDKMNIDPALSGAVVLTTITDVVGFISFLGLATIYLL